MGFLRRHGKTLTAAALVCFFLLRFAAGVLMIRRGSFLQHDGVDYDELARNLAAGRGYLVERVRWFEPPRDVPAPDFSRPPLLPLVLAVFYAALPDSQYVAAAVAAAIGAAGCLACAFLARSLSRPRAPTARCSRGRPVGGRLLEKVCGNAESAFFGSLLLAGLWPVFVYYSAHLSTEALMSLLLAALLLALVVLSRKAECATASLLAVPDTAGRASRGTCTCAIGAAVAGLLLGLSALARPTMLVGFVLVPLWSAVSLRCDRARRALVAGVLFGAACLTVAPWTVRNFAASGELIPVSNLGGYVFWLGNNEDNLAAYTSLGYGEFLEHQTRAFRVEGRRLVKEMAEKGVASPRAQERFWRAEGLRFAGDHPFGFAFLTAARFLHFFRPWLNPAAYGWLAAGGSLVMWGALYAAAGAGLGRLWRRERTAALAVVTVVGCGAAAHALTHVMVRHRTPFLDTAALVLAAPVLLEWGWRLLQAAGLQRSGLSPQRR